MSAGVSSEARSSTWRWAVCGLLLLATMLNYMDRQTLSQMSTDICRELELSNKDYGTLEMAFGLAFAAGGILTGLLVDKVGVRPAYPALLLAWSAVGYATSWASNFTELMVCRVLLGVCEAGQWPCALTTSQRLLSRKDRTLGNSILQCGAAIGAIGTPVVVQLLVDNRPGSWRAPFQVIGAMGVFWVVAWFAMIRRDDLAAPKSDEPSPATDDLIAGDEARPAVSKPVLARRFAALVVMVVTINVFWHFFRAWLPKMLREEHGYTRGAVNTFTSAYYIATDAGCLTAGFLVRRLSGRGWAVHSARLFVFFLCSLLTTLSLWVSGLGKGPLLLGLLLLIGFGALGLFPNYYSFSQDLAPKHQGKVTGSLSMIAWLATAAMQWLIGWWVDRSGSYSKITALLGLAPLLGFAAMFLLWRRDAEKDRQPRRMEA